jgi:Tol biopolymer transport system component
MPFNHPEIKWKTVSTEHFKINYYDNVESAVYPAWKIAEEVYAAINKLYGYKLREKINISFADYDDYSNGWAEWPSANIMIWVPDLRFDLRSNTTWLRNVITHEMTHIISLENKKNLQLFDIAVGVQLQSPDETIALNEPFLRITSFPNWLSEGIAQLETEHQGNDCWDSRRDMILRCAVLDNKILTLDEMGHFNHNSLGNEMVYNQGFSFTKHIEREIGTEKLHQLFKNCSENSVNFDSYFTQFTGYSLQQLYRQWRDSLKNEYESMISGNKTDEKVLISSGLYNTSPEVSPDGNYMAYFSSGKDDGSRTDLYIRDVKRGKVLIKENYAHTALAFSPNSEKIYYVKSRTPNFNGSYFNDIFSIDLSSGSEQRITHDARVYDIAVSSDGNSLYCVRYVNGTYGVYRYSFDTENFTNICSVPIGETMMHIAQCKYDKNKLIFTKLVDGKSQLFIWTGSELKFLFSSSAQVETPMSADDGRIYFSADFDGIFNIYSIDTTGGDLKRHTDAIGGYFTPFKTTSGKILASRYGSSGFSITEITPMSYAYTPDSSSYRCDFEPVPTPKGKVVIKSHPYIGKMLRSVWEFGLMGNYITNRSLISGQNIPEGDTSALIINAMLLSTKSDALHKKNFGLNLNLGIYKDFTAQQREESNSIASNNFQNIITEGISIDHFKKDTPKTANSLEPLRPSLINEFRRYASSEENEEDDSSTAPGIPFVPFIIPGISVGTELGPMNFSFSTSLAMMMFVIPTALTTNVALDYQFTRDLFGSLSMDFSWSPFQRTTDFSLPISLYWVHDGYMNTDIAYNSAGVSYVGATFSPFNTPIGITTLSESGKDSVYYEQVKGAISSLQGMHAFQIAKYSAFQLSAGALTQSYSRPLSLSDFYNKFYDGSKRYYSANVGAHYVFPIFKDINLKLTRYWDALYGKVGYSLTAVTNQEFMNKGTFKSEAFKKYSYYNNLYLDHTLNISLTCGFIKSYMFTSDFTLDFNYRFLERKTSFSILWGI